MPIRARSVATAAVTAALTAIAGLAGTTTASAAPQGCSDVHSASDSKAVGCIAQLHTRAEEAARAASTADEAWNRARQAATTAAAEAEAAQGVADAADAKAKASRARAAAVTTQLARGGGSVGQTTQVLLSGDGANRVLYHLSRMSELTEDTTTLASAAERDERAAQAARAQAGVAEDRLATTAQASKDSFQDAKKTAQEAATLVQQAESKRDEAKRGAAKGSSAPVSNAFVDLPANASTAAKVLAFGRSQIGDPYVFGAAGPGSWDCSGLTMMAYQAAGIDIGGHGATVQYTTAASRGLLVPYSQAQPGDLVFYGGGGDYYHVAIYSGGGNMVEAPHPGADVREVPVRPADLAPMVARFSG